MGAAISSPASTHEMERLITIAIYSIAAVVLAIALLWAMTALSEDYWTNCEQAYQFCERRGYHRDCKIWTAYGKPLSVNRSYYPPVKPNPNVGTPFCEENPWHMHCGYVSEILPMVHEHTECPIPEKYK